MKHVIAFATISACLLVLSGGAALANGSGHPNSTTLGTGQPGGTGGAQCGTTDNGINATNPPPGQMQNSSANSPFNDSSKAYAGSTNPNSNSGNAFSNYDVSCSKVRPGQQVP
jgi:hypothetical protein